MDELITHSCKDPNCSLNVYNNNNNKNKSSPSLSQSREKSDIPDMNPNFGHLEESGIPHVHTHQPTVVVIPQPHHVIDGKDDDNNYTHTHTQPPVQPLQVNVGQGEKLPLPRSLPPNDEQLKKYPPTDTSRIYPKNPQKSNISSLEPCPSDRVYIPIVPKGTISLYYPLMAVFISLFMIIGGLFIFEYFIKINQETLTLVKHFSIKKCMKISQEDLKNGTAYNEYDLNLLENSLALQISNFNGLSALNLGIPLCAIMLKRPNGEYQMMYNVELMARGGYKVKSKETSVFCSCTSPLFIDRWEMIRVRYDDRHYWNISEKFTSTDSLVLQHLINLENGESICHLYGSECKN